MQMRTHYQGFTLIELMLSLAAIVALTAIVFVAFPKVMDSRNATYEAQVLITAAGSTKALFTSGRYDNLTDAGAARADIFPASMVTDDYVIVNQFDNGDVHIGGVTDRTINSVMGAAAADSRLFGISYANVPSAVCVKLASAAAPYFGKLAVEGVEVKNTLPGGVSVPLNESLVAAHCHTEQGIATMTFITN